MTTNMQHVKRAPACPCGKPLRKDQSSYCGNGCRVIYGRFGRTYGVVVPRQFGWTK